MDRISESSSFHIISLTLISVLTSFLLFRMYANYKLNYWKRRGVEQLPDIDMIFGNLKDAILFRTAPGLHLGNLHRAAKKDSPYLGFYIFHKPCLLLRDPEIMKQIFIRDFENFSDRHFAGTQQKDSMGMKNLFGLKSPASKYLRTKITPTLTRGKLRKMFPFMTEIGGNMMDYLKDQKIEECGTRIVDAQELNYKYMTDLFASVALGTRMDSFSSSNDFSKCVINLLHSFKRRVVLMILFFMPELVEKINSNILFDSKFITKVFWSAVSEREKSGVIRNDFIDSLLKLKNGEQNSVYEFEGEHLLYQSGIFFAGFESSSTVAAFTLMELAKNKQCQKRARNDILRAIEEHGWGYEALNDMKYLDQCIAEGVRLHPPVSTIDRLSQEEYKIPQTDIILESGTPIYVSLYGLQKDEKFFEDPEIFDPDRFQHGEQISKAYMPFGLGPRMCIGMKMGQLHAKVVISMILKDYDVHQRTEDNSFLDSRSTLTVAGSGIILHFKELSV